jgi:energy-coupling factor transport system ATP-binding protein
VSLRLSGVRYTYAGSSAVVLSEIDLELERGRVVGVVGPNGSGKSTLCLTCVGLAPATIGGELTGRVTIDELDTSERRQYELAQKAGILFQEPETQLSGSAPTVWEEIAFAPRNLGLPLDEVTARVWSTVDALSIADIVDREPDRLSGGQAQLVAMCGVLCLQPAYLVLDEPTSQLDPLGTRLVGDALDRAARSSGTGILIVEHKTDLLARLCDEIVVLDGGRIVDRGGTDRVLADPALQSWGVSAPAPVRLRRAVEDAGLRWDPAWL